MDHIKYSLPIQIYHHLTLFSFVKVAISSIIVVKQMKLKVFASPVDPVTFLVILFFLLWRDLMGKNYVKNDYYVLFLKEGSL